MNKFLTIIITILFSSIVFGQNGSNKVFEALKGQLSLPSRGEEQTASFKQNYNKVAGDTLWSEDFTNGFPAGWSVYDSTGNNAVWVIQPAGTLPDANFTVAQPTISSVSGGNCMLLYSDLYNSPGPSSSYYEMNSYFQTSAIPVNNRPGITVEFQQSFRWCCDINASKAVLSVSTDSTFTSNVQDYDIKGGIGNNLFSVDPMDMSINISEIAANYVGDIYLRFHVKSGISAYYWMIDDIRVVESPLNDIQVSNGFYGFDGYQYTRIPYTQVQPMSLSMQYNNTGSADQTGARMTVDVSGPSPHNSSTTPITILSLETDTLVMADVWTPSTLAGSLYQDYAVSLSIISDSNDVTPNNNMFDFPPFQITQGLLALDDSSPIPGNGGGSAGPFGVTEYEVGNYFKMKNSETCWSIDVVTGTNTPVGTFIEAFIYDVAYSTNPETYIEIYRSAGYVINASDLGAVHHFLLWNNPVTMMSNKIYFVGVHSFVDYEYAVSGTNPLSNSSSPVHSAIRYPNMVTPNANSSFVLTETPMIRLDFDTFVNIEESNESDIFSISPNPTNGLFTIELLKENTSGIFCLMNVAGKEVYSENLNFSTKQINVSHFSKGIYFYRYSDNQQTYSGKLVIQ